MGSSYKWGFFVFAVLIYFFIIWQVLGVARSYARRVEPSVHKIYFALAAWVLGLMYVPYNQSTASRALQSLTTVSGPSTPSAGGFQKAATASRSTPNRYSTACSTYYRRASLLCFWSWPRGTWISTGWSLGSQTMGAFETMTTGETVFTRRRRAGLYPRKAEAVATLGGLRLVSVHLGLCHRRMCRVVCGNGGGRRRN